MMFLLLVKKEAIAKMMTSIVGMMDSRVFRKTKCIAVFLFGLSVSNDVISIRGRPYIM